MRKNVSSDWLLFSENNTPPPLRPYLFRFPKSREVTVGGLSQYEIALTDLVLTALQNFHQSPTSGYSKEAQKYFLIIHITSYLSEWGRHNYQLTLVQYGKLFRTKLDLKVYHI